MLHRGGGDSSQEYRSYSRRWCLLCTVTLLNVANYAHWISYASVYSKGNKIDP